MWEVQYGCSTPLLELTTTYCLQIVDNPVMLLVETVLYGPPQRHASMLCASGLEAVYPHRTTTQQQQVRKKVARILPSTAHGTTTAVELCRGMHHACVTSRPGRLPAHGSVSVTQDIVVNDTAATNNYSALHISLGDRHS